ncbi:hypothetical protein RJ639_010752 [Escallonia herrerae]|uniref:RNase H type-1 domain-containing protein n=1 Tax=Escallonia herrerae TaxID=1293975 RepID=A0AA88VMX4_9ASTE|nr:hypothetical protein RJ639_010752 [Escallonia herrerae]
MTSCQSKNKEALIIEDLREDTKMQRGEPVEHVVSIKVYHGEENKTVQIGLNLKEDTKLELVNLLRTNADVFAWTVADMPGIDPEVITHGLNVDPSKKPVKQKKRTFAPEKRTFAPERQEKIEEEVDKLLTANSIEEIYYPDWIANSALLVREEDGVQKPIYYVSKVLQDVRTRYPKIDKIALALIISTRRLRPYFQSHTIVVLIDQPLRKAQALADFIVECTLPEDPPRLVISKVPDPWNLYVDGSSAVGSSGAGIILISPEGFMVEYTLRFGFQTSNKEAEYEAFLTEIRLAHALKVDSLSVHSDSLLVVNHILGDYEARDERMAQYLHLVKTLATKFKNFTIQQIPRDQNTQADTLSRLASIEVTDVQRSVYLEFLKECSISS